MADVVTVGATRRDLVITLLDAITGLPVNMLGGSAAARLQGKCPELPAVPIDGTMVIVDGAAGKVKFAGMGNLVSHANLAAVSIKSGTYPLQVKYTDNGGLVDFTDPFEVIFRDNPLGA
jgi:hypothetical protein